MDMIDVREIGVLLVKEVAHKPEKNNFFKGFF